MKPRPGAHDSADFAMLTAERHAEAAARSSAVPPFADQTVEPRENPQSNCGEPRSARSSPDPMRSTDRYRLVMPYSMRL